MKKLTKNERQNKLNKKRFKHELRKRHKEYLPLIDKKGEYSPSREAMIKPKKKKIKKEILNVNSKSK